MLLLNQAALLMFVWRCGVFAVHHPDVFKNKLVYRGESVTLECNKSEADITVIHWTKDRIILTPNGLNQTPSNFFGRLKLDTNSPIKLIISNAQDDDAGLYTCEVTGLGGIVSIEWNLTVSEKPKEETSLRYFLPLVVSSVTGVFLCCIIAAICFCRKRRTKTQNPNLVLSSSDMQDSQEQNSSERRANRNRRSQYMERLNSIYDAY